MQNAELRNISKATRISIKSLKMLAADVKKMDEQVQAIDERFAPVIVGIDMASGPDMYTDGRGNVIRSEE